MMRDIDLRLLRYFVLISEHASFSTAADKLGVSQPALSQGLRRLEDIVGTLLIQRAARGSAKALTLTKAGECLLEESRGLLAHASRVLKRASEHAARTTVRVGFGSSTPQNLTREVFTQAEASDIVDIRLEFVAWGDEVVCLERGDVDAIFILAQPGQGHETCMDHRFDGLKLQEVQELQRLAVFRADHPHASRSAVTLSDLEAIIDAASDRDFWIVNPRPTGRAPVTVGPPAKTVDEMLTLVSAGRGMAITSSAVARKHNWPDLSFVPISDLGPATVFLATLKSERRRAIRSLLQAFDKPVNRPP
jgi:DNA-binding transcriptional LysR family regulator